MDRVAVLSKQIEIDFLKTISEQLEKGEIVFSTAKKAGEDFLEFLPFTSEEDVQKKIKTLVEQYPKLEKVQALLLTYLDQEKTTEILDKLRLYIHKSEQ